MGNPSTLLLKLPFVDCQCLGVVFNRSSIKISIPQMVEEGWTRMIAGVWRVMIPQNGRQLVWKSDLVANHRT